MMKKCIFLLSLMIINALHSEEVLWNYSNTSFSSMPAVHPNGNVLIGDRNQADVIEFNGLTGEIVRRIPIAIPNSNETIEISKDGTRLIIDGKVVDYESLAIIKDNLEPFLIKFLHPRNDKIIYSKDSKALAVLDLNDNSIIEYPLYAQGYSTTDFAVSNDGKLIAVAQRDFEDDFHNHFTLYNGKTFKIIRELEDIDADNREIEYVQFSENAKYVGYGKIPGKPKATFFTSVPPYTKTEFNSEYMPPNGMTNLGFIGDDYLFMTSIHTENYSIIWDILQTKEIYRTAKYTSYLPQYNATYHSLIVFGGGLTALNLNEILGGVGVKDNHPSEFKAIYLNGILEIDYISKTEKINIQILDLKGNVIFKKRQPAGNIEIALNLPVGIYIVQLQDGKLEYSQKFIVTR